jgi:two-component system, chemotaxis family, protein-glutamate methylesterase/glutaminase
LPGKLRRAASSGLRCEAMRLQAQAAHPGGIIRVLNGLARPQGETARTKEMATTEAHGARSGFPGATFDVVAVAASAGGLKALTAVLSPLPPSFPAAIVVVQHLDRRHRSLMAEILDRCTALEVRQAEEGDVLCPGTAFIAPPDNHLLVGPDGVLMLSKSALVHFLRPSADRLFESVAASYGDRAIAVVLTGSGSDGSMGVEAVKTMGGTVIAQDEATSEFPDMPSAAVRTGRVDLVVPLNEISATLVSLIRGATR